MVFKGDNFDGYVFVEVVINVGVSVIIVSIEFDVSVILCVLVIYVEDIKIVLGDLGVVVKV